MLRLASCNRQVGLSLPGSGCLLLSAATAPQVGAAYAGPVLSGLRDSSGRPNLRVKVLAVVVALLLAGPLTVALLRGLMAVVDLLV